MTPKSVLPLFPYHSLIETESPSSYVFDVSQCAEVAVAYFHIQVENGFRDLNFTSAKYEDKPDVILAS